MTTCVYAKPDILSTFVPPAIIVSDEPAKCKRWSIECTSRSVGYAITHPNVDNGGNEKEMES